MEPTSKAFPDEMQKLISENSWLRQQLQQATATIDAIKTGNVDALVIGNEKSKKIFTERTSDKIYRILIEKMHEGAVTLNQRGVILYCNAYFANLLNLPLEKTIAKKMDNFIAGPSKERFKTLLKQSNENPVKEEVYLVGKDGQTIPVQISVNTLVLDSTTVLSVILTDLTNQHKHKNDLQERAGQLEQINRDLESANRDLTSFTYISSHDLQEPLRKIQNFAVCILLEDEKNLSETGKYYLHRMEQSTKRMQALIQDLLVYSQSKDSERKFEDTDLNVIIEEVKIEYEDSILNKRLSIEAEKLCHVNIIPFQFRQLFQNLISNSVKFSQPQTAIHINIKTEIVTGKNVHNLKLSPETGYCHITYTDNGIGFDPQYADYIFDIFKRLYSKEEYEGTGIGLAICKRIVENHKGIITATGEMNKGARFDIYIPA